MDSRLFKVGGDGLLYLIGYNLCICNHTKNCHRVSSGCYKVVDDTKEDYVLCSCKEYVQVSELEQ